MDLQFPSPKLSDLSYAELLAYVEGIEQRQQRFQHILDEQAKTIRAQAERIEQQQRQLDWYARQVFGARSERRILDVLTPAQQLWLGQQFLDVPEAPPPPGTPVKAYERANRKKPTDLVDDDSQLRFDDSVPVQEIIVPDPALEGVPQDEIELIGERVIYRLAQHPGPYAVLKYVLQVAKRRAPRLPEPRRQETGPTEPVADQPEVEACPLPGGGLGDAASKGIPEQAQPTPEVSSPRIPAAVIPRSSADVSFLAGMIVDKFKYHLPLFRQHQRLEASGIYLDRSTMTRLVHRCGELLEPIYLAILSSVVLSKVLAVDESPTPAGRQKGKTPREKGKTKTGYYWALYGDQDEIAFLFSPTRAGKVLDEFLAGFEGVLLSDGYIAYESFVKKRPGVIGAQCWVHTRRNFIDSERVEPEKSKFVIDLLRPLWELEDAARAAPTMTPGELRRLRQEVSRPIVEQFFEYIKKELEQTALLPSNPFVQACEYAIAREKELKVFLEDPAVPMDTNHVERALRPQAVGRKNWMFHVTEVGARYGAIFYSLIQSCVISGVNVTEYLVDVLQRIETHPATEVHLLTPRLWRDHFAANPMRSDLDLARR